VQDVLLVLCFPILSGWQQNEKEIIMESLKLITDLTFVLSGLMAVGITARVGYLILGGISDGESAPDVLKKVIKKISAAVLAICLSTFLGIIKHYYF